MPENKEYLTWRDREKVYKLIIIVKQFVVIT